MDELEKSIPAGEGMIEAEQSTANKQPNENCLNCGTKLLDTYCHHCGQKDIPKRQTLGELWTNFISSFWSYEGKFFQTTKYLITRPGFLAVEYNSGKRESYYHPARMYVFISFVFFLLFFSLPDADDNKASDEVIKIDSTETAFANPQEWDSLMQNIPTDSSNKEKIDSAIFQIKKVKDGKKGGFSLSKTEYKTKEAYDSAQLTKSEDDRDSWFVKKLQYKNIELNQRYNNDLTKFSDDFKAEFNNNFSKVLFWLLPVFALLLKLLYIRKDFFFSEHLVFSIYNYNFFYLAGSVGMLVDMVSWLGWLSTLIYFWIFFYLLFAMKRMYGQPWGKTILKFSLFVVLFALAMGIGFAISAFTILMFL
jgi:Protein of unknown function (DUF3667)